jgi:hypothetical protein
MTRSGDRRDCRGSDSTYPFAFSLATHNPWRFTWTRPGLSRIPVAVGGPPERLVQQTHSFRDALERDWRLSSKDGCHPRLGGLARLPEMSSARGCEGQDNPPAFLRVCGPSQHASSDQSLHQIGCGGARDSKVLRQVEQAGPRPAVQICERAKLGDGEMRDSLPTHLLANRAHDRRDGLHYRLGALVGESRWSHRDLSPCPLTPRIRGSHIGSKRG